MAKKKATFKTVDIYEPVEPFFMERQLFNKKDTPEIPATFFEEYGWPPDKCIRFIREDRIVLTPPEKPEAAIDIVVGRRDNPPGRVEGSAIDKSSAEVHEERMAETKKKE